MNPDKPFKTIEVVDSRTQQVCKVACMSCIRGHRTTSCGIPVCRNKIFWTVKRPGRPSNSCTCRYGATGACKCVIVKSTCPHKSKKGEKRTGECRCDEQGRYCCLLEPAHWTMLLALQKPSVEFHATREALDQRQKTPALAGTLNGSNHASDTTPHTPTHPSAALNRPQPLQFLQENHHNFANPQTSLTPRFGIMGINSMGLSSTSPSVVSVWPEQAAEVPRGSPLARDTPTNKRADAEPSLTDPALSNFEKTHTSLESSMSLPPPFPTFDDAFLAPEPLPQNSLLENPELVSLENPVMSPFGFDRTQADYFAHQFPSAICQSCGHSGCTCRNCPPVLQNFGTSGWSQCCGRKHARDRQPSPSASVQKKMARTDAYDSALSSSRRKHEPPRNFLHPQPVRTGEGTSEDLGLGLDWHTQDNTEVPHFLDEPSFLPDYQSLGLDHEVDLGAAPSDLQIGEFLLPELEVPNADYDNTDSRDCCCGKEP